VQVQLEQLVQMGPQASRVLQDRKVFLEWQRFKAAQVQLDHRAYRVKEVQVLRVLREKLVQQDLKVPLD
jgi:hypothetical protein